MKKLVFIVEDNLAQQKLLQVHFEEMLGNYEVRCYTNPDDVLAHLHEKPFAVVLDHYFPDPSKTGLHYLKELKKKHGSIPVIYYTTATDEAIKADAMKAGADQFIYKDSASLVRLRTALDLVEEKSKRGFFKKLFRK